jgi:hypothetical protein
MVMVALNDAALAQEEIGKRICNRVIDTSQNGVFQRRSDTHQRRNPNFRRSNFSQ